MFSLPLDAANCDGQRKCKSTALPRRAFHDDATAMCFHNMTNDGKTKSASTTTRPNKTSLRTRSISFIESLKDTWKFFWPNPYPCITYKETLGMPFWL